jgi:ubiquinone/menaquinone biosynthesis C-methylase UbiE
VYGPIAAELVALCPHKLEGRTVLDTGAGTGVASVTLCAHGAHPIAVDFSFEMLAWNVAARPPAAVADICALPLADNAVDDSVSAFVLNHLVEPVAGFNELVRVTRPGGAVLACVYSNMSRSEPRDRVDEVARQEGWQVPDWYIEIKAEAVPLLGSAEKMAAAARAAGLADVTVEERAVEVGVNTPQELVAYRFGQAHFSSWLDEIGAQRAEEVRRRAANAIGSIMIPYRPIVVFLSARIRPLDS